MIRHVAALILAALVAVGPARANDPVSLELIFETGSSPAQEIAEIFRARVEPYARDAQIEVNNDRVRVFFWGVQQPEWLIGRLSMTGRFGLHEVVTEAKDCTSPPAGLLCAKPFWDDGPALYLKAATLTNTAIEDARYGDDHTGLPAIHVRLTADAAGAFSDMTSRLIGERIAIVFEGGIITDPVVQTPILGGAMMITGDFEGEEAEDIASLLMLPALPENVRLISQRTGPVAEPPRKSLLQRLFD